MKIAVRVPNWIGDSILSIPAITSLRENFPDAQIWVAACEWVKEIFAPFDFIDRIISLPSQNDLKSLRISAQTLKELDFDVGLLLTNSFSSALLFYLAKIPERWGYVRDGRGFLLTKRVPQRNQGDYSHQVHYYLSLISGLGLQTSSPRLSLPIPHEDRKKAKALLSSLNADEKKPLVILNPGAFYGSAKRWPASKYAALATFLQEKNQAEILIIGSLNEVSLAEAIADAMKKTPLLLTGKTTLRELAALISHAALLITNDSGPMHIANALSTPLVAIFGPTDPRRTGPLQEPSVVFKKEVPCWPCAYRDCPFDHRCMMNIEIEEVFQACQPFLI